jgi:ribose 5-phosphate isomerase B
MGRVETAEAVLKPNGAFGSPGGLNFSMAGFLRMNDEIWIGNDHGGHHTKVLLCQYFEEHSIPFLDIGCDSEAIVRYPNYASKIASAVSEGKIKRGILICSTGIGMSIIANRYPGVRASLCCTPYMGHMTREHNDSNILCLGGKLTADIVALQILEEWLNTAYIGGRHDISLGLIKEAEGCVMAGKYCEPAGKI